LEALADYRRRQLDLGGDIQAYGAVEGRPGAVDDGGGGGIEQGIPFQRPFAGLSGAFPRTVGRLSSCPGPNRSTSAGSPTGGP